MFLLKPYKELLGGFVKNITLQENNKNPQHCLYHLYLLYRKICMYKLFIQLNITNSDRLIRKVKKKY